jgi:EryCIII-like glycosyltransferase
MLVAMFNVVKVESVPLKSAKFSERDCGEITRSRENAICAQSRSARLAIATGPQQTVDAFVTHAGMGSCTEGLWYGVPMVAIPQAVDQPANADQLEAIGAGRHLTGVSPSPGQIRDAFLEVAADTQIRLRLKAIRDELHRVDGPGHAADAVEDVARGRW